MSQDSINQIAVSVQMVSVNGKKSSDFADIGSIKLLIQKRAFERLSCNAKSEDISPIVHAKLVEELRQYVSPALMKLPDFWDDASDKVRESVVRKNLATQFFHTIEFDFKINSMASLDSFDLLEAHVRANDKYEDTLLAHTVSILRMHRKNIHKAIEISLANREKMTIEKAAPPEFHDRCVRAISITNPKLPRPVLLELLCPLQHESSSEVAAQTQMVLQTLLRDYGSCKTANWMRSVSSGSTSYETRLTYLQQVKDIGDWAGLFCSEDTVIELLYEFKMPWFNRMVSSQEYIAFTGSMITLLHRKNYTTLDHIFGDYQKSIGTCHKDGVMS